MRATLLEDCAHNLRIAYELDVPVTPRLLREAGAETVRVNGFSRSVVGANDHISATLAPDGSIRAEAVVGSRTLTVTYGSLHGPARPEAVATVESALATAVEASDDDDAGPRCGSDRIDRSSRDRLE